MKSSRLYCSLGVFSLLLIFGCGGGSLEVAAPHAPPPDAPPLAESEPVPPATAADTLGPRVCPPGTTPHQDGCTTLLPCPKGKCPEGSACIRTAAQESLQCHCAFGLSQGSDRTVRCAMLAYLEASRASRPATLYLADGSSPPRALTGESSALTSSIDGYGFLGHNQNRAYYISNRERTNSFDLYSVSLAPRADPVLLTAGLAPLGEYTVELVISSPDARWALLSVHNSDERTLHTLDMRTAEPKLSRLPVQGPLLEPPEAVFSADSRHLFLKTVTRQDWDKVTQWWALDMLRPQEPRQLDQELSLEADVQIMRVLPSPTASSVALELVTDKQRSLAAFDLKQAPWLLRTVDEAISSLHGAVFHPDGSFLYFARHGRLQRVRLEESHAPERLTEAREVLGSCGNGVYLRADKSLTYREFDKPAEEGTWYFAQIKPDAVYLRDALVVPPEAERRCREAVVIGDAQLTVHDGSGMPRVVPLELSPEHYVAKDITLWVPGNDTILFVTANRQGARTLHQMPLRGARAPSRLSPPEFSVSAITLGKSWNACPVCKPGPAGSQPVFMLVSSQQAHETWVLPSTDLTWKHAQRIGPNTGDAFTQDAAHVLYPHAQSFESATLYAGGVRIDGSSRATDSEIRDFIAHRDRKRGLAIGDYRFRRSAEPLRLDLSDPVSPPVPQAAWSPERDVLHHAFSPDGRFLAYFASERIRPVPEGGTAVEVIDLEGGNAALKLAENAKALAFADARTLLVEQTDGNNVTTWSRVDLPNRKLTKLHRESTGGRSYAIPGFPAWYVAEQERGPVCQLRVIDVLAKQVRTLTETGECGAGVTASPDGRYVFYRTEDATTRNVELWRADTRDEWQRARLFEGTLEDYPSSVLVHGSGQDAHAYVFVGRQREPPKTLWKISLQSLKLLKKQQVPGACLIANEEQPFPWVCETRWQLFAFHPETGERAQIAFSIDGPWPFGLTADKRGVVYKSDNKLYLTYLETPTEQTVLLEDVRSARVVPGPSTTHLALLVEAAGAARAYVLAAGSDHLVEVSSERLVNDLARPRLWWVP